ncbi:MAG: methyltransferase domain-containing protein, partial [Verrucomicrobia bacterium]|nr:methyltransferase domain-containing protein [Verrucomicrobiota bacterium]
MPDSQTVQAYSAQADELAAQYRRVLPPFLPHIVAVARPGGSLLDVGCGSGRDLAAFAEEGFDVRGIEPVDAFRRVAERDYPALRGRLTAGSLPDDIPFDAGTFDVIHCAAVLMHLPSEQWLNAIFTLRNLLKPEGILHLSFSPIRSGLDPQHRSPDGRLFTPILPEQVRTFIQRAGFRLLSEEQTQDSMGRPDIQWVSMLAKRSDEQSDRPLQRIEIIVNHDTKDATYKLALLRALADLAGTQFHNAKWLGDGRIAIPADLVVELWIKYYWPLFAAPDFIAQKNGENLNSSKPIAFRKALTELIGQFQGSGGYPAYREAQFTNPLVGKAARDKIRKAIQEGPVVFASGKQFTWQRIGSIPHIVMPTQLWTEFSDLHHWIEPAIRLQWAEETHRMSKGTFTTGEILSLLSTEFSPERDTLLARQIFKGQPQLTCTWSQRPLLKGFDVDHIIPYSLWHDNSLWNLVPAAPTVNNRKGDKLIAR